MSKVKINYPAHKIVKPLVFEYLDIGDIFIFEMERFHVGGGSPKIKISNSEYYEFETRYKSELHLLADHPKVIRLKGEVNLEDDV